MAFLIDEDMTISAAASLRDRGYEAAAVKERALRHSHDYVILWQAVLEGRSLLTHNDKDFAMLHGAWRLWGVMPPHFGILVIPQIFRLPGSRIADAVVALPNTDAQLRNELYLLTRDRDWIRPRM